jgi:hypothetical protein
MKFIKFLTEFQLKRQIKLTSNSFQECLCPWNFFACRSTRTSYLLPMNQQPFGVLNSSVVISHSQYSSYRPIDLNFDLH